MIHFQSEPILRIGIILPIDCRKNIEISFSDSSQYTIDSKTPIKMTSSKLTISIDDGDVYIKKINSDFDGQGITIHDVPAGRGFHWQKTIDVTLPGNVEITNHNGLILLTNHVPLEQYLPCVAVSEMSGACPTPLLEAQTITARSWIMAAAEKKHSDLNLDACNDDCCQRYQGVGNMTKESKSASEKTRGMALIYNGKICDARYSKSCGGISEDGDFVWDMPHIPYLTGIFDGPKTEKHIDWSRWFSTKPDVFCGPKYIDENELHKYLGSVDKNEHYFRWNESFTQNEFCKFFSEKINEKVKHIHKIDALNRGKSGRINHLYLDYETDTTPSKILEINSEYDIRKLLHPSFLYSSAFQVMMNEDIIELKGAGWGHGVGLCQIGALGMVLHGYKTEEILTHYFSNSSLETLY